jgi:putative ABC transport system permease protein
MLRLLATLNARFAYQRGRTLLSVAGIALGVALGFGVQLVNRAAVNELAAAVRTIAGEADLEVRGGRNGFPEALYAQIARLPGVALASPVLELEAGVAGTERRVLVLGIDVLRAAQLHPRLLGEAPPALRYALLEPDRVLLSAAAAKSLGLRKGGRLTLVAGLSKVEFEVADVLPAASLRGVAVLTDIATAQWRLRRLGELNRIDLRLAPGIARAAMRARIAALLPAGVFVSTVQAVARASADPSHAYRVNMNVLALVALFTGGFLVFSAQALEVARRRGEHALLRVLGLERRGVARLVMLEAAAIGLAGSALGLALGYALAAAAVRVTGADLGAGVFRGVTPQLGLPPGMLLAYLAAGVAIALAGAALPALDAAVRPPARALKAGDEQDMFAALVSAWPGIALIALGAGLAQLGPVDGTPLYGYLAIACLLLGAIALMPRLAQLAFDALPLPRQVPAALALEQLRGAPGQAMVSLAAIVASFSLMVAMAIMVASFRESVDEWLEKVLPADLYFRTTQIGDTGFLEPGFERRVLALPQIARAEFMRTGRLSLDAARPPVSLLARDFPRAGAEKTYPLVGPRYAPRPGDPPPIWVSEAVEDVYGFTPGARVELPLAGRQRAFVVVGVWRDYARQNGAILMNRSDYVALTGDRRTNDAALWLAPGASPAQAMHALRALPGGAQLDIARPGEIRSISLRIFDRSFAVTYAIEAVAVLVGLFGLSSSLGAIVLARRREFGMLRHLGMTRAQIGAMLALEGGLLAVLGALAGLAVGGAISQILIHVVNRQSFNWGMETHLPYGTLAALTAVLVLLAALTAWLSGREAMGIGPVRAVREDW